MSDILRVIIGELFGTALLILLGNAVVCNVVLKGTKGNNSGWIVVCVGWGFAVTLAAFVSGVSGAHLNPAVTIGLLVGGEKTAFVGNNFIYAPVYIVCQLIGAMLGQLIVYLAYFKEYKSTTDKDSVLATFSTSPVNRSYIWNTVTEAIGTFVLLIIIIGTVNLSHLVIEANLKHVGPILVGIGVMVIGLALGGPTGFAINPARDLGPRIIHAILPMKNKGSSDWSYAPVPVIGPIIGAIIAGGASQLVAIL